MKSKVMPSAAVEVIYLAGLGAIFGNRIAMLEHFGRVTGERHYAILRILDRPSQGSWLVAARKGTESHWYLNVQANPYTRLYLGSRKPIDVKARPLPARVTVADHDVPSTALVLFETVGQS